MNDVISKDTLLAIAQTQMPFGKYAGRLILDLPEEYLLWFQKKGFPTGPIGQLMALTLELKIQGADEVLKPLRSSSSIKKATHMGSHSIQ